MADDGTALRISDLVVTLVQSGGIAGLEMQAVLKVSELPPVDADGVRGLLRRVLAESKRYGVEPPAVPDACEYELTVSEAGAEQRIVTGDGALTPAERELIGLLRPRLTPVRAGQGCAGPRPEGPPALLPRGGEEQDRLRRRRHNPFGTRSACAPAPTADLVRERDVHAPGARREADFDRGA